MRKHGRILVCGSIQNYNDIEPKKCIYCLIFIFKIIKFFKVDATNISILMKELSVYGFMVYSYYEQWPQAFTEMNKLIQEKKLKVKEQVYTGFDNMKEAFLGLFKGENTGKAVVRAVNAQTNYP